MKNYLSLSVAGFAYFFWRFAALPTGAAAFSSGRS